MKVICLLVLLGWLLPCAAAHPADMLVQAAYITLSPERAKIELDLTAGELVAADFLQKLKVTKDQISRSEIQMLAKAMLEEITLVVNSKPIQLELESSQIPDLAQIRLGSGQMQLVFSGAVNHALQNQFIFKNNYAPIKSGYLANVFIQSSAVKIDTQKRDEPQQTFEVAYTIAKSALPQVFAWWFGLIPVLILGLLWLARKRLGQFKAV